MFAVPHSEHTSAHGCQTVTRFVELTAAPCTGWPQKCKLSYFVQLNIDQFSQNLHPVHVMNAEQYQTAADPWTKPTDLSHWPACRQLRNGNTASIIAIIITQPES